jgi:Zn-dependent peptidase ImmA (M78 family)/plasmid maintenance system antidote protein VapI
MAIQDLGDNVRRLMKLQELTIPALAERMGMGSASISNLLNGKTEPKSSTLIKLAEGLGASIQDLLADVPKLVSLRFRTAKTLSAREKAERDQLKHITARWIDDYKFLEEILGDRTHFAFLELQVNEPRQAAIAIRDSLKLELAPIHDIVDLVNQAGIKLRVAPFGFKKTFGLSVGKEDGGPAIVVNSEPGISIERQIFTIAHELGHLLLHTDSYSAVADLETEQEEREANSFAGQLLLPDEALVRDWKEGRGVNWVDAVLRIKKKYKVSYMTVLVRLGQVFSELAQKNLLVDFRIAYRRLYNHDLKDHYEPNAIEGPVARSEADGLSASDLTGDRFSRLVMAAYEKSEISIGRASEMVGCSLDEMRSLVKGWQDL